MLRKFKEGQKVRITGNNLCHDLRLDLIHEVVRGGSEGQSPVVKGIHKNGLIFRQFVDRNQMELI